VKIMQHFFNTSKENFEISRTNFVQFTIRRFIIVVWRSNAIQT